MIPLSNLYDAPDGQRLNKKNNKNNKNNNNNEVTYRNARNFSRLKKNKCSIHTMNKLVLIVPFNILPVGQ